MEMTSQSPVSDLQKRKCSVDSGVKIFAALAYNTECSTVQLMPVQWPHRLNNHMGALYACALGNDLQGHRAPIPRT